MFKTLIISILFLLPLNICQASRVISNIYYEGSIEVEYYIFELDDNTAGEYKFYKGKEDCWAYYKPEFGEWHKVKTQEEMNLYWRIKAIDKNKNT